MMEIIKMITRNQKERSTNEDKISRISMPHLAFLGWDCGVSIYESGEHTTQRLNSKR